MSLDDERERLLGLIGQMERRIDAHERELDSMKTVPATLQQIDRRLWEGEKVMLELKAKMEANTAVTTSIREAQIAGKVVNGVGKWVGALILGVLAFVAAIKGVKLP